MGFKCTVDAPIAIDTFVPFLAEDTIGMPSIAHKFSSQAVWVGACILWNACITDGLVGTGCIEAKQCRLIAAGLADALIAHSARNELIRFHGA